MHDCLQLSMQRNLMNSAIFFNHTANVLVLDNPTTPLASASEPLPTMLILMQMMMTSMLLPLMQMITTSTLLPLMIDWTMMLTLTSCKLAMTRYQGMKLLPILRLTVVYTLQIADMLPFKTVPKINNGKKQTRALKTKSQGDGHCPAKEKGKITFG